VTLETLIPMDGEQLDPGELPALAPMPVIHMAMHDFVSHGNELARSFLVGEIAARDLWTQIHKAHGSLERAIALTVQMDIIVAGMTASLEET